MTYTLLMISLVVLNAERVEVTVLTEQVTGLTWQQCKTAEREVRAKGPQWQARCVKEVSNE